MGFVPTSFVERKSTLEIDKVEGESNGTLGNNKEISLMKIKEKKGDDGGLTT